MLYNEFIEGTGCKDSEHNYNVYKELEIIYMNTDCSKAHIYEMGKKLVDNSKSEAELKVEAEVKTEIVELKELIKTRKENIERCMMYLKETDCTKSEIRWLKDDIKRYKENIKHYRNRIAALKWVLV